MSLFKKAVVTLLILSIISLHLPQICYCWQNRIHAKADTENGVTKHTPEFVATEAIKIPIETVTPARRVEKKKTKKWLWVGLGVLAAGVLAGAGGGGGGNGGGGSDGGGGGGDGGDGDDTGSIVITGPAP